MRIAYFKSIIKILLSTKSCISEYWKNGSIEQKRISSAGQTSAGQTGPRYYLLLNIPFFQYSLIHNLAPNPIVLHSLGN